MQQLRRQAVSTVNESISVPIRVHSNCEHNKPISCVKGKNGNGILVVKAFGQDSVQPVDTDKFPNDIQPCSIRDQELRLFHERERKRAAEFARQQKRKEEELRLTLELQKQRLQSVRRQYAGRGETMHISKPKSLTAIPYPDEVVIEERECVVEVSMGDGGEEEEEVEGRKDDLLSMTFRGWHEIKTAIEEQDEEDEEKEEQGEVQMEGDGFDDEELAAERGDEDYGRDGEEEEEEEWEEEIKDDGQDEKGVVQGDLNLFSLPLTTLEANHQPQIKATAVEDPPPPPPDPPLPLTPTPAFTLAPKPSSGPQLARMRLLAAASPSTSAHPPPAAHQPHNSPPSPAPSSYVNTSSFKIVHLNSFLPGCILPTSNSDDQPSNKPFLGAPLTSASLQSTDVTAAVLAAHTSMRVVKSQLSSYSHPNWNKERKKGAMVNQTPSSSSSSGLLLAGQWYKGRLLPTRLDCSDAEGLAKIAEKAKDMGVTLPPLCACPAGGGGTRERQAIDAAYVLKCATNCPLFHRPKLYEKLVNDLLVERGVLT